VVRLLVLLAGAVSGILGVLYALAVHDLKRLLAYSSIENIGIIYMGLGAALIFTAHGARTWAALALAGALLHALNHALFKSLLFLGAGAVADSTHTVDLENWVDCSAACPSLERCFSSAAARSWDCRSSTDSSVSG